MNDFDLQSSYNNNQNSYLHTQFENFDFFGKFVRFNIKGQKRFKTKIGAILTFIYFMVMAIMFYYYCEKWYNKSSHILTINSHKADKPNVIDLISENVLVYIQPFWSDTGNVMDYFEFWKNFSLYATLVTKTKLNFDEKISRENLAFIKCEDLPYVKSLKLKYDLDIRSAICLNANSIKLYGAALDQKTSELYITLHGCSTKNDKICENKISIKQLNLQFKTLASKIQFDRYETPISKQEDVIYQYYGEKNLRYFIQQNYKKVVLYDKQGIISQIYKKNEVFNLNNDSKLIHVSSRSAKKILKNSNFHKKIPMEDYYVAFKLGSSEFVEDFIREYIGFIDVLSNIGGLFTIFSCFIMFFYSKYNSSQFTKKIVNDSILVNPNHQPEKFKKINCKSCIDYICCLFNKKRRKSIKNVQKETKTQYENCSQILQDILSVENFIQNSMYFSVLKNITLKPRHQILMPIVLLNLQKIKRFEENLHSLIPKKNSCEKKQQPVFTVEDAIAEINQKSSESRSEMEKSMDDFCIKNQPEDILHPFNYNKTLESELTDQTPKKQDPFETKNDYEKVFKSHSEIPNSYITNKIIKSKNFKNRLNKQSIPKFSDSTQKSDIENPESYTQKTLHFDTNFNRKTCSKILTSKNELQPNFLNVIKKPFDHNRYSLEKSPNQDNTLTNQSHTPKLNISPNQFLKKEQENFQEYIEKNFEYTKSQNINHTEENDEVFEMKGELDEIADSVGNKEMEVKYGLGDEDQSEGDVYDGGKFEERFRDEDVEVFKDKKIDQNTTDTNNHLPNQFKTLEKNELKFQEKDSNFNSIKKRFDEFKKLTKKH